MTDKVSNIETERGADYYCQPWTNDAVPRYFYAKVNNNTNYYIYNNYFIYNNNYYNCLLFLFRYHNNVNN